MCRHLMFCLFMSIGLLTVNVQRVDADISGKVSNKSAKAIAKAVVSLVRLGIKDTTDANGLYELATSTSVDVTALPLLQPSSTAITLFNGFLDFSLLEPLPVKFGSFKGGHTDNNTDAGSSGNWISKETWEFFMRF